MNKARKGSSYQANKSVYSLNDQHEFCVKGHIAVLMTKQCLHCMPYNRSVEKTFDESVLFNKNFL